MALIRAILLEREVGWNLVRSMIVHRVGREKIARFMTRYWRYSRSALDVY